MTQDITPQASRQSLKDAATLAIHTAEHGLEPLPTAEAQAFFSWLHAVYLSIFLHVDDNRPVPTLLHRKIERMAEQGISVLTSTLLSNVASLANKLVGGFYLSASPNAKLDSQALLSLAVRLPLGPITKALVVWVDLAYGDAPRAQTVPFNYFSINADGSLNPIPPVVESFKPTDMPAGWLMLPAFWRILHVVSKTALPYKGSADNILNTVVSRSALPLDPYYDNTISFPNYVALIENLASLFATAPCAEKADAMLNRLLQPWMGRPIRGAHYAEMWLRWMQSMSIDGEAFHPHSIYTSAFRRHISRSPFNIRIIALEALNDAVDPNPPDKPDDPNPNPDKAKPDDTAKPPETDTNPNTPAETTDPTAPPAAADPNAPALPEDSDKNNTIGSIMLEKDSDPGNSYLYKRAVLALDDVLSRDPHVAVDQKTRESLHLWCRDWLWLANVTQTEGLIKALGLQKTLGLIKQVKD